MQLLTIITVGYITGIIWGLYLKTSIVPIIFLSVGILVFFRKKIYNIQKYKWQFIFCIIALIISNSHTIYLENKYDTLYKDSENINVVGIITSNGKQSDYTTKYMLKVESINGDNKYKNTYLNLYVKNDKNISYGKRINFIGTYSSSSRATNYKGFDYLEYLKTKYIYGEITLDRNLKVSENNYLNPILIFSNNIKDQIEQNLDKILNENSEIVKRHFIRRYIRY